MLNTVIVGASGYAGAELAALVQNHPQLKLFGLYVSAGSQDAHKRFSSLHPQWVGALDQPLLPLDEDGMTRILTQADLVLLATAHEVSAELAPKFLAKGLPVFDLSGAFRVKDQNFTTASTALPTRANSGWIRPPTAWRSGMPKRSRRPS